MPDDKNTQTQSAAAKEQATAAKDKAAAAASSAAESAKAQARDVADTVSAEATNYAYQARDTAADGDTAADEVKGVASALRTAADELRSGSPQERSFSQLADGLADVSDTMRDKDLGEMMGDLNGFAKRNPLVFLGGAALLGFVATRFAKASSDRPQGGYGGSGVEYDDDDRIDRPMPGTPSTGAASTVPGRTAAQPTPQPAAPNVVTGEKA